MKVLFVVEGFTDIRFVAGLSEISNLSMLVPKGAYSTSGLDRRIEESGASVLVHPLSGGRLEYQMRCFQFLWKHAAEYDVILSQEMLRGSLNSCIAGRARRVPVVTYMAISPVEYFRCRRERKQIGPVPALAGEAMIRFLLAANGLLATRCIALGPYLLDLARAISPRAVPGLYYGIDTDIFRPAGPEERQALRVKLGLPLDRFLIVFSSRISHEKDPETVLRAAALARRDGLGLMLLNLGGGYREFLRLADTLNIPGINDWVIGRPAVHPITELSDYYRAADALAQASLAEGLGLSPLESLACGTPAVCTAVGGMRDHLVGYARLTRRRDPQDMAHQLAWIACHPSEAREQALRGREYVIREWSRDKAFGALKTILTEAACSGT
jgi:glycosyltransferase involved in cell wall biosynthesis